MNSSYRRKERLSPSQSRAGPSLPTREAAQTLCAPGDWDGAPERLYQRVRTLSGMRPLDDDFSVLTMQLA